ncbi:MAG TPA: hypothetical protein VK859_04890 [bacterium]|jgi:hypothetical protein|nr:hypothetical protein [bacterium]
MRLQTRLGLMMAFLALPLVLWADVTPTETPDASGTITAKVRKALDHGKDPKSYRIYDPRVAGDTISNRYDINEAQVDKLDGTIMVQHADNSKPTALQTLSTIQKGDILYVYDNSWVILKDHKGDHIGVDGGTVVTVDEFYIQGPDRQIRLLLQKGSLLLKTSGCGSRQSFFEINSGSVVTAVNDTQSILSYDPDKESLMVKYFTGKLTVIDRDNEQKFKVEHSENTWLDGKMAKAEPDPVEELDEVNFNKFFDGDPRIPPPNNDFLLPGSD